jgi:hypothetical protein
MILHKKVIQALGKKKKARKKLNYKPVGNYKFKARYDFDNLEDLMEQKKYLLSLGWEVRYETLKNSFVLRGYYDFNESDYDNETRGRVYAEYHDRRYVGIIQPEILNQKESFTDGRKENVQNVPKGAEGKTGKVLLGAMRK